MFTAINDKMDFPNELVQDAKTTLGILKDALSIRSKVEAGSSLSECIQELTPLTPSSEIEAAVEQLEGGVDGVFQRKSTAADLEQSKQDLNKHLAPLDQNKRGAYLVNYISLLLEQNPNLALCDDAKQFFEPMGSQKSFSDQDMEFLLDITQQLIDASSRVLSSKNFQAIQGCLQNLTEEQALRLMEMDEKMAKSYAAACYAHWCHGENFKLGDLQANQMTAASIGAYAAVTVETSKLMGLYRLGKVTAAQVESHLHRLIAAAQEWLCENWAHIGAVVLSAAVSVAGTFWFTYILVAYNLVSSPLVLTVAIGALLAIWYDTMMNDLDAEKLVQDAVEALIGLWAKIKEAWSKWTCPHDLAPECSAVQIVDAMADQPEANAENTDADADAEAEDTDADAEANAADTDAEESKAAESVNADEDEDEDEDEEEDA